MSTLHLSVGIACLFYFRHPHPGVQPASHVITPSLPQRVITCISPRCRSTKPQVTAAYKEGLYQKTAGPWMEDVTTTLQPLPFNLSQVRALAEGPYRVNLFSSTKLRGACCSETAPRLNARHASVRVLCVQGLWPALAGAAGRGAGAHQHLGLAAGHHHARRLCQKPQAQVQWLLSVCVC